MFYLLTVKESLENKNKLNIKMIVDQSKNILLQTLTFEIMFFIQIIVLIDFILVLGTIVKYNNIFKIMETN